ncbi:hypothetical protein QL285_044613 [Trifolium repens]|nr:hypothetical protein QL285_044613 [Trifolium repens]
MDGSYGVPRSWIPHGRGGFFFLLLLSRGGDGRFLPNIPLHALVCRLSLHEGSYFWGEDALCVACRPRLAFPPSYLFEFDGLDNWATCLLGPVLLFLGFTPVQKENLQKQEKASRQSPRCKKTRKGPKSEENQHSLAARWLPSCHDGNCLFAKKSEAINLKKIFASQHDGVYRNTMT